MVLVSPYIEICDFFFFHYWHVGVVSEKQKKKETLLEHRSSANHTSFDVRHDAKNGVSVQPSNGQLPNRNT